MQHGDKSRLEKLRIGCVTLQGSAGKCREVQGLWMIRIHEDARHGPLVNYFNGLAAKGLAAITGSPHLERLKSESPDEIKISMGTVLL